MKTKLWILPAFCLMVGSFFVSCSSADKAENAQEDAIEAEEELEDMETEYKEEINEEWGKFKADADERMREYEADLAEQREKIAELKDKAAQAEYEAEVAELERRNVALRERVDVYEPEDKTKWEQFKEEFRHDMDELGAAIKNVFKDKDKAE